MIRILVDSASDYTIAETKEKNIELVPISFVIGEKSYTDGYGLTRDGFYELLKESGSFPTTSQPSPQAFLDIFEDVKANGDSLICILLSSALSGTYQSALLAKNMVGYESIHLIDSRSATYTVKIMADHACRMRDEGCTVQEIVQSIEQLKSRVKVVAALDTLEYLARGGRISKTTATIGDLANIKPLITISEAGEVEILGKCLGKNKAIAAILKHLQETGADSTFPIYPIYSYGIENCEAMQKKLQKEGFCLNEVLQIGSTIGSHIGPGAFGIVFVSAN